MATVLFRTRQWRVRFEGGFVFIDADGDSSADMIIDMNGLTSMTNNDFLI